MALDICENDFLFRKQIYNLLLEKNIIVRGYHNKEMRIDRDKYNCLVQSISGYSMHDNWSFDTTRRVYKSLVDFKENNRERLEKEPVFDIRKYIFYHEKCQKLNYHITCVEFNNLIDFFRILIDSNICFHYNI